MSQTAKHIVFAGRVQGVGFRFTAHRIANQHRLSGYVRNCADGTVEMVAQGPDGAISSCLEDIKASFGSYIRKTRIEQVACNPGYTDFRITF